jgi:hypothetical protein
LGHHRIWDDSIISPAPYAHDKSYLFDEIYPVLQNNRVKAIFAGNSKRQYFTDFQSLDGSNPNWGKQNINNIYWCDMVGDIAMYSVGTGSGIPKLGFVKVTVFSNRRSIMIEPHFVSANYRDPIFLKK